MQKVSDTYAFREIEKRYKLPYLACPGVYAKKNVNQNKRKNQQIARYEIFNLIIYVIFMCNNREKKNFHVDETLLWPQGMKKFRIKIFYFLFINMLLFFFSLNMCVPECICSSSTEAFGKVFLHTFCSMSRSPRAWVVLETFSILSETLFESLLETFLLNDSLHDDANLLCKDLRLYQQISTKLFIFTPLKDKQKFIKPM